MGVEQPAAGNDGGQGDATGAGKGAGGESGGGAYPNPHTGKEKDGDAGDFDGGQSEKRHYGGGDLAGEKQD